MTDIQHGREANWMALSLGLRSLSLYSSIMSVSPLREADEFLAQMASPISHPTEKLRAYAEWLRAIFLESKGRSFHRIVLDRILTDQNPFTLLAAQRQTPHKEGQIRALMEAAAADLIFLQELADLDAQSIKEELRRSAIAQDDKAALKVLSILPGWPSTAPAADEYKASLPNEREGLYQMFAALSFEEGDWSRLIGELYRFHQKNGVAVLLESTTFQWEPGRGLRPVPREALSGASELYDYTHTLEKLRINTETFLAGEAAENVLLYGPRGTGKSSSVRLMLERYARDGLRLIELRRENLAELPEIFASVSDLQLFFIVFIDDLSFPRADENYQLLKNILEGSVLRQADNVKIYVTSNRRHLVNENFSDTENALYANDVRDERLSLAERFGLRLRFTMPGREDYLNLIHYEIAKTGRLLSSEEQDELDAMAMRHAANEASMSPRSALNFIRMRLPQNEKYSERMQS